MFRFLLSSSLLLLSFGSLLCSAELLAPQPILGADGMQAKSQQTSTHAYRSQQRGSSSQLETLEWQLTCSRLSAFASSPAPFCFRCPSAAAAVCLLSLPFAAPAPPLLLGIPLGLAMGVPKASNPLALGVLLNTAAPLLSVAQVGGVGSGLGAPVMQLLNAEANALKKAIAVQIIVTGQTSSGSSSRSRGN